MLCAPRAFFSFLLSFSLPLNSAAACNAQRGGNGCKDRNGNLNQCFPSFFRHSFFSVSCLILSDVIGRIFSDVIGREDESRVAPGGANSTNLHDPRRYRCLPNRPGRYYPGLYCRSQAGWCLLKYLQKCRPGCCRRRYLRRHRPR